MSQCYELLISSLLGNVNIKQDLRQVLLNLCGRHPGVAETPDCPGAAVGEECGELSAGLHPGSGEAFTVQCSPAHLKLIAGTKAFHINLISADAQPP